MLVHLTVHGAGKLNWILISYYNTEMNSRYSNDLNVNMGRSLWPFKKKKKKDIKEKVDVCTKIDNFSVTRYHKQS